MLRDFSSPVYFDDDMEVPGHCTKGMMPPVPAPMPPPPPPPSPPEIPD